MPSSAANAIWPALRSGDVAAVSTLLAQLPGRSEWLRANGDAALNMARAKGHGAVCSLLQRERQFALETDAHVASLDRELQDELAAARRSAAQTPAYLSGYGSGGLGVGAGTSGSSNLRGIDPLRRMMRDGDSDAASSIGSSRSGRSSRRSSRSGGSHRSRSSKRSGKSHKSKSSKSSASASSASHKHRSHSRNDADADGSTSYGDDASVCSEPFSDEDGELEELDDMLDAMRCALLPWLSMGFHGLPWASMAFHGLPWPAMALHSLA